MKCYKTRSFTRWAKKVGLSDKALYGAWQEIIKGLIDADLGGGIIKKRVALPGRGKSGSTRTLIATNKNDCWIFLLGFEKNERANISGEELEALQLLASDLLALSSKQISISIQDGALAEIADGKQKT